MSKMVQKNELHSLIRLWVGVLEVTGVVWEDVKKAIIRIHYH